MRRCVSVILVITLLFGVAPLFSARAESRAENGSYKAAATAVKDGDGAYGGMVYSISDGAVTITGVTDELPAEVTVPETIDGLPVTAIGDEAFRECETITTISMPSVTTVGRDAFFYCIALTTVDMPVVISIDDGAFCNCGALTTIIIGNDLESVGESAFFETAYYLDDENWDNGALYLSDILLEVMSDSATGEYAIKNGTRVIAGGAFMDCYELMKVSIPASTSSIGSNPFIRCHALSEFDVSADNESFSSDGGVLYNKDQTLLVCYPSAIDAVVINHSVKTIGKKAFYQNNLMTALNTSGVTDIGARAFSECYSLASIDIFSVINIGEDAFSYCGLLTQLYMPNVTTVGERAFSGCYSLETVTMEMATGLGDWAFSYCNILSAIDMPAVTSIGEYAFAECLGLGTVSMPVVISIADYAFLGCTSLETIDIPASTTSIGKGVFMRCTMLATINIVSGNANYSADGGILYDKERTLLLAYPMASGDLVVADTVTAIGGGAFTECYGLTSIDMPAVKVIGVSAFENCTALLEVMMPAVTDIEDSAFASCYTLGSVNIPFVTTIGDNAFSCCYLITTVDMPAVTAIGEYAFSWCSELATVSVPALVEIGYGAFIYCELLTEIDIPACTTFIGINPFSGCTSLTVINVAEGNPSYSSDTGALYNKDKSTLLAYPSASGDIVIPDTVTTIAEEALLCTAITSLSMPSVQKIRTAAIIDCSTLRTVEMPAVESVASYAFAGCVALQTLNMPAVTEISNEAFYYCNALTTINIPSAESIGAHAFYSCYSITEINLYDVVYIGDAAFSYCYLLASARFYSDAPAYFGEYVFEGCAEGFKIYYIENAEGWTTPLWNGYPTQAVSQESEHTVTFIDGHTDEIITTQQVEHGGNAIMPTPPTHTGYTFASWDKDGTNITADTTITAQYDINLYLVTFVDGCVSETLGTQRVEYGKDAVLPTPPEHEGYTFTGWDKDGRNITEDTVITAIYEQDLEPVTTHTVTFVDHDGTVLDTQTVNHGAAATAPADPVRVGYTFAGWDKAFTNVTADLTVTATYTINSYTVTFMDGYSGEVISTVTVEHGSDAVMPTPPEHEGYTFTGWDSDGTNITGNTTITAQYEENRVEGDVTGDGRLNTGDAVMILRRCAGLITFSGEQEELADFNNDGRVNTGDAVAVLRYCAGLKRE